MIEMDFVPNESGEDCFRASLANLLKLLGDDATADQVEREFWSHELMQDSICSLFLLPRYVEDLTGGRYVARLTTLLSPERIRRMISGQPKERQQATMDELQRGRVLCRDRVPLQPLSIIVVRIKTAHAAVYVGDDVFVDDGQLTIYRIDQLPAVAVLTLTPQVPARVPVESYSHAVPA